MFKKLILLLLILPSLLASLLVGAASASAAPVVPERFKVGIARDVAIGPFESSTDVIRTDIFLIGGKNGMESRVGSVKIQARHLSERDHPHIDGARFFEPIGNGKFSEQHRSGRSVSLTVLGYCHGWTEFATEVILTVYPTVRAIYMGYRPTTKRYFVRSGAENIDCDDRRSLPTGSTPVPGSPKPWGGRY